MKTKSLIIACASFVFSLLFLLASFVLQERVHAKEERQAKPPLTVTVGKERIKKAEKSLEILKGKTLLELVLEDYGVMRFSNDAEASLSLEHDPNIVDLKAGKVWVNLRNTLHPLKVRISDVELFPDQAIFSLERKGESVLLISYANRIDLFLFGNELILPEGRSIEISLPKLSKEKEKLKQLKYSKLAKEFPFTAPPADSEWVNENRKKDNEFENGLEESLREEVRRRGPIFPESEGSISFTGKDLFYDALQLFTFDTEKRNKRKEENLLLMVDDAMYYGLLGKNEVVQKRFDTISEAGNSLLQQKRERLTFARLDSPFVPLKEEFRKLFRRQTTSPHESFALIRDEFKQAREFLLERKDDAARERAVTLLRAYGKDLFTLFPKERTNSVTPELGKMFFQESIELSDFFDRYPEFLRREFLEIESFLEKLFLSSLQDPDVSQEERQFFTNDKLKKLNRIKALMTEEAGDFRELRKAALALLDEITALKPESGDAAILNFFDEEMKRLSPFIDFLNSPEGMVLAGNFNEAFKEFLQKEEELDRIKKLLSTAQGGEAISKERREELVETVASELASEGVKDFQIDLPKDEDDPKVVITKATLEGISFLGIYDTEKKLFTQLVVNSEPLDQAVRLGNLRTFLLLKTGKLAGVASPFDEEITSAEAEAKAAIGSLMTDLTKASFTVHERDLSYQDEEGGIITVKQAVIPFDQVDIKVSFEYERARKFVRKLKITLPFAEIPVNESFDIAIFPLRIQTIYNRAIFERAKEEQLNEMLKNLKEKKGTST